MIDRKGHKRRIDADRLRTLIKERTSIRAIGRAGVYNEKTIRRGLSDGYMSTELIFYLAYVLWVPVDWFADMTLEYPRVEMRNIKFCVKGEEGWLK